MVCTIRGCQQCGLHNTVVKKAMPKLLVYPRAEARCYCVRARCCARLQPWCANLQTLAPRHADVCSGVCHVYISLYSPTLPPRAPYLSFLGILYNTNTVIWPQSSVLDFICDATAKKCRPAPHTNTYIHAHTHINTRTHTCTHKYTHTHMHMLYMVVPTRYQQMC